MSADSTDCTTCHEGLLRGTGSVHAPVQDDCTFCHEMETSETGTRTRLMAAEPELCLACHDDLSKAAAAEVETPHFPVVDSCLTCHDPHGSNRRSLLLSPVAALCSGCHDAGDVAAGHGGQITASTDCTKCHAPHGSDNPRMLLASRLHAPFEDASCQACHRTPFGDRIRMRTRGEKLCLACHGSLTDAASQTGSVHAALEGERGRAGCLSCHDPHMSDRAHLVRENGPALCGECHLPIVQEAAAETGHPPAAEDCGVCHQPHASEHASLLSAPATDLCWMCHDSGDADLVAAHLGADLESLDCTTCHSPHGTGHPSLLASNVHAPVLEGCELCHEGAFDELMEDGESSLCLACHDDVGEAAASASAPHGAMEVARCADCHNPHASPQDKLVKLPGGGECLECHDDVAPGTGEVGHGVIDAIGCRACHEPHGGDRPKLLRATGADLCLACHDPARAQMYEREDVVTLLDRFQVPAERVRRWATLRLSADGQRDHPVPGHRVLGLATPEERKRSQTTFEGELTCLTCHDPHRGRTDLLRWDAASSMQACNQCHTK